MKNTIIIMLTCGAFALGGSVFGQSVPKNLDGNLQRLITRETKPQALAASRTKTSDGVDYRLRRQARMDAKNRVMVNIHLDGTAGLDAVRPYLGATGGSEVAATDTYAHGIIAAFVPVNKLAELAGKPGVLSITLASRPIALVGKTTTGGAPVIKSDVLNGRGIDGTGITVGALSDSYDKAVFDLSGNPLTVNAADDVASDDLPGTGNSDNPNPVVVLDEYQPAGPDDTSATDEGRAMLQIVHDVAPKAKLAFASAFNGEVQFAQNIRRLRTRANCDVITDDVFYFDEPMFSDGIVAQAVDAVVNSNNLAGKKCSYFSSAGNQQGGGWTDSFNPVSDSAVRQGLPGQNLNLAQVPQALTNGGFHNFSGLGGARRDVSQTFKVPAGTPDSPSFVLLDFQWDDPFFLNGGVTTDYNVLVFDASGNYIPDFSGIDDNTATQAGLEFAILLNTGPATTFQIAITRAGNSPSQPTASRLRYLSFDQFNSGYGAAEYYQEDAPTTFGHNCANGAIGTAAYVYDDNPSNPPAPPYTPAVEDFTSSGPVLIALRPNGTRYAQPQVRLKPDLAAPDGGNTTFFGFEYEGDGFPNFFGTSAAAPHAAGAAALLLQKAGGPSSLTNEQIRVALQNTARSHDLDSFFIQAIAGPFDSATVVTGHGNSSTASSMDPNFFTVDFHGQKGDSLRSVTIDLTNAGLKFDSTTTTGFPFRFGQLNGVRATDITVTAPLNTSSFEQLTLNFAANAFKPGDSVSFGIDRDIIGDGGGNTADLLQRGRVIAQTWNDGQAQSERTTFQNTIGSGYAIEDGFGLIDAAKAANQLPRNH